MNRPASNSPGDAPARPKLRHRIFRPFVRLSTRPDGEHRYQILWTRLASAIFGGAATTYVLFVCAVFLFVRYRQHIETVGILDLLLPTRWENYPAARENYHVATARRLVREGKRLEALLLVRTAVTQSPGNRDGRLLLAKLLLEAKRPEAAQKILLEGLNFHRNDPAYLHPLLVFLLQQQQDARVIALARTRLRPSSEMTECNRLLAFAAASASFFQGSYDQADDFLRMLPAGALSHDRLLLTAKIDWERGYRDLALVQLRTLASEFPHDPETHATLVAYLEERGLHDEARRLSLSFQIAHPTQPSPRIELLNAYHRAGDHNQVAREAAALLRDFASDSTALLALANFAAGIGDVPLARRLADHAATHGLPHEAHSILVVEALIVARDYQAALDSIHALLRENPGWNSRYATLLGSLQAVAYYGLGNFEAARLYLANFLNQPNLRAENLLALAQRLADIDAGEEARRTLLRAVTADPLNQAALTRLVEFDLNLNRIDELPAHLRRLLAMRKPSPDILRVAQHKLGSDLYLFSAERPATLQAVRAALERAPPTTL